MAIKIKCWKKVKDSYKEVLVDISKIGFTPEQWFGVDEEVQEDAISKIPNIKEDWGYSIVKG